MQSLIATASLGVLTSVSIIVGGVAAAFRPPGVRVRSYIQHVAAGFVFAAAAVEVLPDVMHRQRPLAAALGFAAGVALALAIRIVSERAGAGSGSNGSFIGVLVVDLVIDGVLIGVAATSGEGRTGLLVAVAVSAELFALGLSMAAVLGDASRRRVIATAVAVAPAPLLGTVGGYFLGGVLGPGSLEATLAFAVAVFLFMAAEELLKEAHESAETPLATSLFFVAFLCLLLLDMLTAA